MYDNIAMFWTQNSITDGESSLAVDPDQHLCQPESVRAVTQQGHQLEVDPEQHLCQPESVRAVTTEQGDQLAVDPEQHLCQPSVFCGNYVLKKM